MKNRKVISCLLAVFLIAALPAAAGCGGNQGGGAAKVAETQAAVTTTAAQTTTKAETTTAAAATESKAETGKKEKVRFLYPGGERKYHQELTAYVNELLDRDKMNIEFEAKPIGWDVWEQKINLMFQTQEEFEFVHVPEGFGPGYVELWNRGASIRLNELLDEHAPTIKKVVPKWLWEAATIGGSVTTIPAFWVETAHLKGGVSLRKDLYEKYGMSLPTNLDELVEKSIELQKHIKDDAMYDRPSRVYMRFQEIQTFPHRTYDTYPFTVIDQLLLVRQDGSVESWVDSAEFKKDCEFYNKLYTNGLIMPELLSVDVAELSKDFDYGNYLFSEWNTINSEVWQRRNAEDDTIASEYVIFNKEKPIMRDQGVRNSNIVSSTSPNPAAAVRFHEWFYANDDAYRAVQFGKEGLNYNMVDGEPDFIPDEPNLGIADWMVANINIQKPYKGSNAEWVRLTMTEEMNAVNSVTIGFAFDTTKISTEYGNCLSELKNVIYPMRAGVVSYADGYENASKALKQAGIEVLVKAYQEQITAWLASKK